MNSDVVYLLAGASLLLAVVLGIALTGGLLNNLNWRGVALGCSSCS